MGHPCCNEFDCKEPLAKITDLFCGTHEDLGTLCAVQGCRRTRRPGHKTCSEESHKEAEAGRMRRRRKLPTSRQEEEVGPTGTRRKKLKGAFGRKWTHNEQLMVRPCGIVIGRATLYSSESVSAVKVSSYRFRVRTRQI